MLLGATSGFSNGANIQLWSASPTPTSTLALYAGAGQQGKPGSQLQSAQSLLKRTTKLQQLCKGVSMPQKPDELL